MTSGPLVSTIIPVHNRPALLEEAVGSVLAQTYRPVEVLIVDDGSTDATADVAARLADRQPEIVRVLSRTTPGGPGVAREAGRLQARGQFIQYLDSDDLLLPRKFELQVAGLIRRPDCGVSYGMSRWHGAGSDDPPIKRTGERVEAMFPSFLVARWWDTHTPLYRREVCDRAGGWLPLWNEEDWEYDCRVAALGTRLDYVPEFVSETRRTPVRLSGNLDIRSLRSRALAHAHIYGHALVAGIGRGSPEMDHFARELFLLARQGGEMGLEEEGRMLFHLAHAASAPSKVRWLKLQAYGLTAACAGWRAAGRLAAMIDHSWATVSDRRRLSR